VTNQPDREAEVPDIDVVVPTRDRPELLRECIRSILKQEYPGPIRVLVVYDQSEPDRTLADEPNLGSDGTRRRIEVVTNQRTPGLAGARNSGILAAGAELVAFCDDDDQWLPGKLSKQVNALSQDPGAEFVCCGIDVQYDGESHKRTLDMSRISLQDLLRDRLTELHPSTFVMRRKAVVDGFGLVEENIPGSYAEDYEFLLRASRHHVIANVPDADVRVLWSKGSYFTARWETMRCALTWLLEKYPEFDSVPKGQARVMGQIAFAAAADGDRRAARHWAGKTLRRNPREGRGYLALAVASGIAKPDAVLKRLHKMGRGI